MLLTVLPIALFTPTISYASPPAGWSNMTWDSNVNVDGFISDVYSWYDSTGNPRSAAMVKNDRTDPANARGGYMRQFKYVVDGNLRTVTARMPHIPVPASW